MEIRAEFQGLDSDKAIWQDFHRHWLQLFPNLNMLGEHTYGIPVSQDQSFFGVL